jgi:hypothetical protein
MADDGVVELFPKRQFDFSNLRVGSTQTFDVLEHLEVSQFRWGTVELHVHDSDAAGGTIVFDLCGDGQTNEDVASTFVTNGPLFPSSPIVSSGTALLVYAGRVPGEFARLRVSATKTSSNPLRATASARIALSTSVPMVSPRDLPGLVAWFDMQDATSYAVANARVGSIRNNASGVLWTEATSGPVFSLAGLNRMPALQCNGANRIISSEASVVGACTNSPAVTVFGAIQSDLADNSVNFFAAANSGVPFNSSRGWGTDTLGAGNWLANAETDAGTAVNISSGGSTDNTSPNLYEYWTDGAVGSISINGGQPDPSTAAQVIGTLTPNRCAIGCVPRSTPNGFWSGKIGEIVIYNRQLSPTERALIRNYLAPKWSISCQ